MPKMKSHSGAKKRFKRTATGKIRSKCAWTSHRLIRKEKSAKRRNRGTMILAKPEGVRIKRSFLPYAR